MTYLKTIIQRFDSDSGHLIRRSIDVLDMIEYAIGSPSCNNITDEEIKQIELCVKQLLPELKEDPILQGRIKKWWKNCKTLQVIASHIHMHDHDHIDTLHYHEEILSIKRTKKKLIKLLKGEESTWDDHGLFGTKCQHTNLATDCYSDSPNY